MLFIHTGRNFPGIIYSLLYCVIFFPYHIIKHLPSDVECAMIGAIQATIQVYTGFELSIASIVHSASEVTL